MVGRDSRKINFFFLMIYLNDLVLFYLLFIINKKYLKFKKIYLNKM